MEKLVEVLKWFKNINNKNMFTFMKFDVVQFYTSISKILFINSIEFQKKNIDVSNDQIKIILHSCKTTIFFNDECWIKNNST